MENLNAEQVKKALECCFAETMRCEECPRYDACREGIAFDIPKCTLAIINSQEQRIKELETRLCHLLQSKTIAKYDEVNIHTKEYLKDIHLLDANIEHLNEQHKLLEAEIERLENIWCRVGVLDSDASVQIAKALYNAGYCLASETADKIFSEIENTLKDCLWFLENHPSSYPTMDRTKIKVYKDTLSYLAELKKKYVKSEET